MPGQFIWPRHIFGQVVGSKDFFRLQTVESGKNAWNCGTRGEVVKGKIGERFASSAFSFSHSVIHSFIHSF